MRLCQTPRGVWHSPSTHTRTRTGSSWGAGETHRALALASLVLTVIEAALLWAQLPLQVYTFPVRACTMRSRAWLRALACGLAMASAGIAAGPRGGRFSRGSAPAQPAPLAPPARRGSLRLRLRGGCEDTERVLQARMATERAEVEAGWYNATSADVFPWDGWQTAVRDELADAPHVGFLAGTGRWLGPSLAQERRALEINAEVDDLGPDAPAAERTRRFLQDADAREQTLLREGGWHADAQEGGGDAQQAPDLGRGSMFAALEREEAHFAMLDAGVTRVRSDQAGPYAAAPLPEESDGSEAGPGEGAPEDDGAETAAAGAVGERARGAEGSAQPVALAEAPAPAAEAGAEWGEMRGKWRERAAMPLRNGQKFLYVDHDPEAGVRLEFVADNDTSDGSDVDICKAALPAGWTGEDSEDERALADFEARQDAALAAMDAPDAFPQHGYSMAAGRKWEGRARMERGATETNASPMTSRPLPHPAGPRPLMAGVRPWAKGDPRLAPGTNSNRTHSESGLSAERLSRDVLGGGGGG